MWVGRERKTYLCQIAPGHVLKIASPVLSGNGTTVLLGGGTAHWYGQAIGRRAGARDNLYMLKTALQLRVPEETHARLAAIVEAGGGRYQGVFDPDANIYLVMFDSPATGSTLALPEHKLTPEAVRERIAESNKTFSL